MTLNKKKWIAEYHMYVNIISGQKSWKYVTITSGLSNGVLIICLWIDSKHSRQIKKNLLKNPSAWKFLFMVSRSSSTASCQPKYIFILRLILEIGS